MSFNRLPGGQFIYTKDDPPTLPAIDQQIQALQNAVKPATTTTTGVVEVGSGLEVDATGIIKVTPQSLPIATASAIGAVKIGTGLSIDGTGLLSALAATPIPHGIAVFTSSGTWTAPATLPVDGNGKATIYVSGAAAGAGGNLNGGGGGGECCFKKAILVVPGTSYNITIGIGGTGKPDNSQANPGGLTSFGSLLTLTGGAVPKYNLTSSFDGGGIAGGFGGERARGTLYLEDQNQNPGLLAIGGNTLFGIGGWTLSGTSYMSPTGYGSGGAVNQTGASGFMIIEY